MKRRERVRTSGLDHEFFNGAVDDAALVIEGPLGDGGEAFLAGAEGAEAGRR